MSARSPDPAYIPDVTNSPSDVEPTRTLRDGEAMSDPLDQVVVTPVGAIHGRNTGVRNPEMTSMHPVAECETECERLT